MLPAFPRNASFSRDHLWVRVEGNEAVVGITPLLVEEVGTLAGFALPPAGDPLVGEVPFGNIRGSRSALDLPSPLTGEVVEVNEDVLSDPALAEEDPFGEGWLFRMVVEKPGEMDALMSSDRYRDYISGVAEADES